MVKIRFWSLLEDFFAQMHFRLGLTCKEIVMG